ncbi:hypothetical protein WMY93_021723 [Mugilogobius chulae]|uniref:5'-AMP-activated protein kinase subunit beta-1 n=1 Tax=Mugilogobius chulae TaxID=88201 RepID=A0AAW0NIM4_9GOBI
MERRRKRSFSLRILQQLVQQDSSHPKSEHVCGHRGPSRRRASYKFYVDGQWTHDPAEPVITSQMGTVNNIIQVKKTDFEVFDALMVDSQKCSDMSDLSSSPPGPYHQDAYVPKQEEKFKSPPILPPHLLQVILNKDTGISCDPALLPEPNHVMLNHLYALSIKDGVMVLSATHRYKKKYVTTLLYKPI